MSIMRQVRRVFAQLLAVIFLSTAIPKSSCSPTSTSERKTGPSACRLPYIPEVDLSIGHEFPDSLTCVPSIKTMKASMFFVDFADQPSGNDTAQGLYNFFFPNASTWYETSAYGKLSIDTAADTSQFYRMPLNASEYAWDRGLTYEQHKAYIQDALSSYANTTGADPASADVLYIVAGRNSPLISFSPTFMDNVTTHDGTIVANKAVTVGYDAYAKWGFKLINHETGHVMCLADLYPATGPVGQYVGEFDIMGNINALYPDYFAWDKWRLGWLEDSNIECVVYANESVSTHTIYPLAGKGEEIRSVVLKRNETQALVLETRAGGGTDGKGGKPGVVAYTVDTNVSSSQGPIRILAEEPLGVESELEVQSWDLKISVVGRETDAYTVRIETGSATNSTALVYGAINGGNVPLVSP